MKQSTHATKSVRFISSGETEVGASQHDKPSSSSQLSAGMPLVGTHLLPSSGPLPPSGLVPALGYAAAAGPQPPISTSIATPIAEVLPSHSPPLATSLPASLPVVNSSPTFAFATSTHQEPHHQYHQQQQPLQPQQQSQQQQPIRMLSDLSDVLSLTILGDGTGPAHTIPISSVMTPTPAVSSVSTAGTTHKRAFSDDHSDGDSDDSPASERQAAVHHHKHLKHPPPESLESASPPQPALPASGGGGGGAFKNKRTFADSPLVAEWQAHQQPAGPERPSVMGSAFTGTIVEREPAPLPLEPTATETTATGGGGEFPSSQPPLKKMSRFRAARQGQ